MVKKIKTFRKNRICKFPKCRQVLNIYNPSTLCYIHQQPVISKEEPVIINSQS
ncbi:MAG: hypothetical protein ABH848_02875 [Candidatus Omnitrophota bacterium]